MQKDAKNDVFYHFSELFYDFSWVYTWQIFMKNHEISPFFHDFGPKITQNR